jgi:hypothetical protein
MNDPSSFLYYTVLPELDPSIEREDMYNSSRMDHTTGTERDFSSNIAILSYECCRMRSDISSMSSTICEVIEECSRGTGYLSCHTCSV